MALGPAAIERLSGKNRFLIAACDEGQKSIESPKYKHGLFTFHLIQGMRGKADRDGDGKVGIAELFNYVSVAVARDAHEEFQCEQKPWFKGTWTDEVFLAIPGIDPTDKTDGKGTLERLWRDRGADDAMSEVEKRIREPDEAWLRSVLDFLRRKRDPVVIPFLFGCLAHTSETVRRRARSLLMAYGWQTITAASTDLARKTDSVPGSLRMGLVLEGLKATESNPDVISLLNRLVDVLRSGMLRDRAISLLDHKRLSGDLEQVRALFLETKNPYRIEKLLGPGMFTAAYLASHLVTGRPAVVRVLRPQFVADDFVRTRFNEASDRSFRSIHQNLISTRDVGAIPDRQIYFTVRDFIEGVTLKEVLARGKRIDPLQALEILRQVLEGLTPVHQEGTVHGGIKPSNVFLSGDERVRVILGDLGLGVVYLHIDRFGYDYRYAAPEIFQGQERLTPQADFYSLGCLGYELICGVPPFVSDHPADLMVKHLHEKPARPSERGSLLGPRGDAFFERLLAKLPSQRFNTLDAALGSLDDLRGELLTPPGAGSPSISILGPGSLSGFDPMQSIVSLSRQPRALRPGVDVTGGGQPSVPEIEPAGGTWSGPAVSDAPRAGEPDEEPTRRHPSTSESGTLKTSSASPPATDDADTDLDDRELAPLPIIEKGHVIFDKYLLEEKIGEGGMGQVWRVQNVPLDREVALKLIRPEYAQNKNGWLRFEREARLMAKIEHPNVVAVYALGRAQSLGYIEMEFVPGRSLEKYLKEREREPVSLEWTAQFLDQLCSVLHKAHEHNDMKSGKVKPIIHRDLKPSNLILVEGLPDGQNLKVLDFGIAKMVKDEGSPELTGQGDFVGTPYYMSPEQILGGVGKDGQGEIDSRSDIYSVGVLLYQLLTGSLPFIGRSNMELLVAHLHSTPTPMSDANPRVKIPRQVERLVMGCLEKDPDKRPQSARELAVQFREAIDLAPPGIRKTSAALESPRRKRALPIQVAWVALLVLLVLLVAWRGCRMMTRRSQDIETKSRSEPGSGLTPATRTSP